MSAEAFVTLATSDSYCMGAIVVARSLRRHGTTRSIVVMVTPNVSQRARLGLEGLFDKVIVVDVMDSEDQLRLSMLRRPELGITFTKLHCWTLTQYSKCVFLDADTLVLCNVDELFDRDELSAAPDPGWPDCFNSGVFVFRPCLHTHARLLEHALQHGSFDGGDQGLLNTFFSSWSEADISKHLPFIYNLTTSSTYTYLPAFKQFGHNAKIVHFLGVMKPWSSQGRTESSQSQNMGRFLTLWWNEYRAQKNCQPPASEGEPPHKFEKTQQVQREGAKSLFSKKLEISDLLLTQSSVQMEEMHSMTEPKDKEEEVKVQEGSKGEEEVGMKHHGEMHTTQLTSSEGDFHPEEVKGPSQFLPLSHTPVNSPVDEDMSPSRGSKDIQDSPLITEGLDNSQTKTRVSEADRVREELQRRQLWEAGQADYMGRDAFKNIKKMLDCFLE
ncbi:glycogenin-2 isoform X2 [Cynoglossus semilaevis]|uniref:glycogenin-2 isoform X2 n=1 Tax=Cynoglossus semilaevis TaxID=244447 RepID=UPI000D62DE0B|nr:glycogenin-1 isoform X2 [Cynoglossus semilaevis]